MIVTQEEINYIRTAFPTLQTTIEDSYKAGYKTGKTGDPFGNCHFSLFRSEAHAAAWSEGKADAEVGKPDKYTKTNSSDGEQTPSN